MVQVGKMFGRNMTAVITDMNEPLGNAAGNSLEIIQTIEVLKNKLRNDFSELSIELAAYTLLQTKISNTLEKARSLAEEQISSGKALEKFIKMIELQNGDTKVIDDYSVFGKAENIYEVKAIKNGYLKYVDTRNIGVTSCLLGAGRLKTEDKIDPVSGIIFNKKTGDKINKGDILFELHYNKADIDGILKILKKSYDIIEHKPDVQKRVLETI